MTQRKIKRAELGKPNAIVWTDGGWNDYLYWQKNDVRKVERINSLLKECVRNPFFGRGKPEILQGNLKGYWSRRIDREHRLIYFSKDSCIFVIKCRAHY